MSRRPPVPRAPGESTGGSGARGIVLLGLALVLGVFVLNQTDPGSSAGQATGDVSDAPGTTRSPGVTTVVPTTAPRAARAPAEVKVLPANGSGVAGLGGRIADRLKGRGYTNTLAAVNTTREVPASSVEFNRDFEPEARAVAEALGLPPGVVRALDSPPVADTRGADIVVLIGPDLATGATGGTTTTSRAGTTGTTRAPTTSTTAR